MERISGCRVLEATILAVGILLVGYFIKSGIDDYAEKDRQVTVKGLAEREVAADKVTWPISMKETDDDLPKLYARMEAKEKAVRDFLVQNGVKPSDITGNAPSVVDLRAEQYSGQSHASRYIVTSAITVTSHDVQLVRKLMARQGELVQKGIAVVAGGYDMPTTYEYESFQQLKPKLMEEAIANAEKTAGLFAQSSHSKIDRILRASQGQFSIEDRDRNTPYIKKIRVVTTITYSLRD